MLKKNLDTILEINETLHAWLTEEEDQADWYENIKNNMLYVDSRKRVAMYDLKDPVKETKEKLKDFKFYKTDVTILIGCGLGFVLNQVLKQCEDTHRIIIIEHDKNILKNLLSEYDYSEQLKSRQLIIVQPEREWIIEVLGTVDGLLTVEEWHLMVEAYAKKRVEYLNTINIVIELINQFKCNTGTVVSAGDKIADNDILTLPYLIKHRGINELKDLYKGKPAILVSTGPSLSKNIHLLQNVKDKVIIIAVGQALRILLAYGIKPDFICTVDFGEVNMAHFKGLMNEDVPLIALNRTYAPLLKEYQAPIFVVSTPTMEWEGKAVNILSDKGFLQQGGSVAHLCLSSAIHLGCDPIVFIGQDLSLSENSHCKQADASGEVSKDKKTGLINWKVKDPRCKLHEQTYSMGPAIHIPGFYDKSVLTNIGLASFVTSFENIIRMYDKTNIINATEGGAHIPKTKRHTLEYVIKKHCLSVINKTILKPLLSFADNGDDLIKTVIPLLKDDIKNMKDIIKYSKLGTEAVNKLSRLLRRKKTNRDNKWGTLFEKFIKQNEKYSTAAHKCSQKVPLINVAIYGAVRAIKSRALTQGVSGSIKNIKKSDKIARIRIKRNKHILTAAKKAAIQLCLSTEKTLKALERYMETKDINTLKPKIKEEVLSLEDAQSYLKAGNFARPFLIAKKIIMKDPGNKEAKQIMETAIIMREKLIMKATTEADMERDENELTYNALIEKARELGRDHEDYDAALLLLKDAVKIFPDREIGLYGLACAYVFTNKFKDAIPLYKKIIKMNPDDLDYQFELGRVLMNLNEVDKIQEGITKIIGVMQKTEKHDGFLVVIGDFYNEQEKYTNALELYDKYLEKFPADYKVWIKKSDTHKKLNEHKEAKEASLKAKALI